MKRKSFVLIFFIIDYINIVNTFAQTNWLLDNPNSHINTSIIDSITYTKKGDSYCYNLWYNGKVIEKNEIMEGDSLNPKEVPMEYEYCSFEEDGKDGILTTSGLYAIFEYTSDSIGYVLTTGNINSNAFSCLLTDSLGFVKAIKTSDNRLFQVMYTPNELWLIDSEGKLVTEIPYSEFDDNIPKTNSRDIRRAWALTRSRIYQTLSIFHKIKSYYEDFLITALLDLLYHISEGVAQRNGELFANLVALGVDWADIFSWIETLEKAEETLYFGNASLTALDAIKQDPCSFITPCKVEGLSLDTKVFNNMSSKYMELMNYSYTLKMTAQTISTPHRERQTQETDVTHRLSSNSTYDDFVFDFQELQKGYEYEPSLTLSVTTKEYASEIDGAIIYYVNPNKKKYDIIQRSCTIYGKPNALVTGSVSSKVEKVINPKATTADIICSFSETPKGAECGVSVTRKGSDIGLIYFATQGKSFQSIKATGLSVNTTYVVTTYITFNGKTYDGTNSVEFTTSGPSGSVISVDNVTDKSAVAICHFSGVESGVECGIIAKSSSQTLTFPASVKEGEQTVPMSGLTPATKYQCYAYVRTSNFYQEQKNGIEFTTDPPDLSGTWNCITYSSKGSVWETWTIVFNKDGKGSASNGSLTCNDLGWSIGAGGAVEFGFYLYSQTTGLGAYNSRHFSGTVNNLYNPTSIEGKVESTVGNVITENRAEGTFVMTK